MKDHDIVWLGWCNGRWTMAGPPLCLHAYALSRLGAIKAHRSFKMCGAAVDEQVVTMAKMGILRWRKAFDYHFRGWKILNEDYNPAVNKAYTKSADPTEGIFHQKKLGSYNGHTGFKLDSLNSIYRKDVDTRVETPE